MAVLIIPKEWWKFEFKEQHTLIVFKPSISRKIIGVDDQ